jgi:hypothetical protein
VARRSRFRIAGERWLVEGLGPGEFGGWARPVRARDLRGRGFDVRVKAEPEASARGQSRRETSARSSAPPPGMEADGTGFRLRAESFSARLSPGCDEFEVRGLAESLPAAVRLAARLAALVRLAGDGRGLGLHASAVVRGGRAFVFAGPAGAGKTTLARNAARATGSSILADDLVILRREEGSPLWRASGLPWEAEGARPRSHGAPVEAAALLRITKSSALELKRLTGARAAAMALSSPPEALGIATEKAVVAAARLAVELPVLAAGVPAALGPGPRPSPPTAGLESPLAPRSRSARPAGGPQRSRLTPGAAVAEGLFRLLDRLLEGRS